MTYAIEKDIPLPKTRERIKRRGRAPTYPFKMMKVGDSFVIPDTQKPPTSRMSQVSKDTGYRFEMRNYMKGLRIWRIK